MNYPGPNIELECQERCSGEHAYGSYSFIKRAEGSETELAIEENTKERQGGPYRAVSGFRGR